MAEEISHSTVRQHFIDFVEDHLAGEEKRTIPIAGKWPLHSVEFTKLTKDTDEDRAYHWVALRACLGGTVFNAMHMSVDDEAGEFAMGTDEIAGLHRETDGQVIHEVPKFTALIERLLKDDERPPT